MLVGRDGQNGPPPGYPRLTVVFFFCWFCCFLFLFLTCFGFGSGLVGSVHFLCRVVPPTGSLCGVWCLGFLMGWSLSCRAAHLGVLTTKTTSFSVEFGLRPTKSGNRFTKGTRCHWWRGRTPHGGKGKVKRGPKVFFVIWGGFLWQNQKEKWVVFLFPPTVPPPNKPPPPPPPKMFGVSVHLVGGCRPNKRPPTRRGGN